MEPNDVWIGMNVSVGVGAKPRKAQVCGEPYEQDGRWKVPVEYLTAYREDVPLTMLSAPVKYAPDEVRMPLKDLVKVCNTVLPREHQISSEQLVAALKKRGLG